MGRAVEPVSGESPPVPLRVVLLEWTRIGLTGFGGPPAHIALLREMCVKRRRWIAEDSFEDGIAATNLLPGPASTQLAIFCAWRVRGLPGAAIGGLGFIVPGLIMIIALAALFLSGSPPEWVLGAGAGAGAAVAAVAVRAGVDLLPGSRSREDRAPGGRWPAYVIAGGLATAFLGPWLVLVLLGCGLLELALRRSGRVPVAAFLPWPVAAMAAAGGLAALSWTAFKVGALSYGGGFVIIPLMQADAVDQHQWMTGGEFLNAVALGQITPGPVVQTVAVVGYAAAGVSGALLAAAVAFLPSFAFVFLGAERFDRLTANRAARAFLAGAGPAAIGAILGSAVPLSLALASGWQYALLAAALIALFPLRRGVVFTLVSAALVGAALALAGVDPP